MAQAMAYVPATPGFESKNPELVIVINRGKLLCAIDEEAPDQRNWRPIDIAHASKISHSYIHEHTHEHFLGHVDKKELVARFFNDKEAPEVPGFQWVRLRELLGKVPDQDFQLAGRALQITRWYREHQYCGVCATKTVEDKLDRALVCPRCDTRSYPRISPCVIGLVVDGDKCLLAQGVRHPEGLYSTLAGFVEPGESAEQAFIREVWEEVGVDIRNLRYICSQPWPFPGQLMIGFIADYAGGDIRLQKDEIVSADWFSLTNLPNIPPPETIAGRIIKEYRNQILGEPETP